MSSFGPRRRPEWNQLMIILGSIHVNTQTRATEQAQWEKGGRKEEARRTRNGNIFTDGEQNQGRSFSFTPANVLQKAGSVRRGKALVRRLVWLGRRCTNLQITVSKLLLLLEVARYHGAKLAARKSRGIKQHPNYVNTCSKS